MVSLPTSGVKAISLWIIVLVSFIGGLFSGFLGGGAGYIRMPMMVYVLGIPTHLAVGTDLFEIIISASYGTFSHAIKGNVDILIALVMHTGAAIGAQIGAILTQYFAGPENPPLLRPAAVDRGGHRHLHFVYRTQTLNARCASSFAATALDPADSPSDLGGLIAGPGQSQTTLLGIAEDAADEEPLRRALEDEAERLRQQGVLPNIVVRSGEPIRQILAETTRERIRPRHHRRAAQRKRRSVLAAGEDLRSDQGRSAAGAGRDRRDATTIKRILVCTGGKRYIDDAVQLAGEIAKCIGGTVTLLHVMAEPPAIYADLVRLEEDVDRPARFRFRARTQPARTKGELGKMGLNVEVRIRHGLALDQIFAEVREGKHDLIVTGTSQARGPLRHYIMGDLTRGILNRADCPVLVARAGKIVDHEDAEGGFFHRLLHGFERPNQPNE